MRRKDKEISDPAAMDAIIKDSRVCRLGLTDGDRPYIVPMNFGYAAPHLYFHSALKGRKLDLIRQNPKVCFEFDRLIRLHESETACKWGAAYQSIVGEGIARILSEEKDKREGLKRIMAHYTDQIFEFPDDAVRKTAVIRVEIQSMTGKISG